jgi:hypothetical protein
MTQSIQLGKPETQHHEGISARRDTPFPKVESGARLDAKITRLNVAASLLALIATILLWTISLRNVDISRMTDVGLVSVLPPTAYLALLILIVNFVMVVHQRQAPVGLLLLQTVTLILIFHGTPNILYGTLRYSWAWKHVGIVDYIQRFGTVDPGISYLNAYQNWPGFFALNALITEAAGFKSALSYAAWGPVFYNLLDLGALLLLFKTKTNDQRLVWLGIWFFYLTSWVGQDYFSPQATAYFLYLVVLGICLRWFKVATPPSREDIKRWLRSDKLTSIYQEIIRYVRPDDSPEIMSGPLQRLGLMTIVILISAVVVSSHQLTPFMLIGALSALVIFQRCNARSLPILIGVLTGTWVIYMAVAFVDGNITAVLEAIGRLSGNFGAGFINLSLASPGQRLVAIVDRVYTFGVGALAFWGLARRFHQGYRDLSFVLLAISSIPFIAVNPYGGEMILRTYLFALPFMAFFAAALLYPRLTSGTSWKTVVLTALLSSALLAGFLFAYYGKDRMFYFSHDEVAASEYLYNTAPPYSLIVDATGNYPRDFKSVGYYDYAALTWLTGKSLTDLANNPADVVAHVMNPSGYPASYLIITRSQKAAVEMLGLMPAGLLDKVEQAMELSPKFKLIYTNKDAQIFILAPRNNGGNP